MLAKLIPIIGNTSHPCMRLEALSSSFSNKLLRPLCRMALKYTCLCIPLSLFIFPFLFFYYFLNSLFPSCCCNKWRVCKVYIWSISWSYTSNCFHLSSKNVLPCFAVHLPSVSNISFLKFLFILPYKTSVSKALLVFLLLNTTADEEKHVITACHHLFNKSKPEYRSNNVL